MGTTWGQPAPPYQEGAEVAADESLEVERRDAHVAGDLADENRAHAPHKLERHVVAAQVEFESKT